MAGISTQMTIRDGMTAKLNKITQATQRTNRALSTVDRTSEGVDIGSGFDTAEIRNARSELARTGEVIDDLERRTSSTNDAFSKLAKAIGIAAVAHKAFEVLKGGIDYASDLAEVQNVVDVTFGNAAATVNDWSKTALSAYGINEVSAKRYAGTMGAMLKSSGMAGDSIVGMSQNMVALAGDMASFYNLDLETAFEKIRSGISGETEPLKQLGVNMSVANLEAYALSQGITKSYNSMSQAEQVALRYNYLLNATADAQGDFARTSGSWANQTRLLSEGWTQFTGVLAQNLLPALTTVVTFMNNIISFLTANADTVSAVIVGIATAVGILTVALVAHKIATWLSVAANQALVISLLTNPLVWIAIAIGVVVGYLYKMIKAVGGVRNAWEICKAALVVAWAAIKVAFFAVYNWIANLTDKIKLCWQKAGVAIANFLGDMKVSVLTILQNMINGAINIINDFIGVLNKIPGVNIDLIEQVTFATTAAAENEAAKQARADALNQYESDIKAAQAQRDATYSAAKQELADAQTNLSTMTKNFKEAAAQENTDSMTDQSVDTVDTVGSVGSVDGEVNIAEEDLQFMRDVAEMRYVQNFVTLTPTVAVDAQISETVDVDEVVNRIEKKLEDEFTAAAEGVYE